MTVRRLFIFMLLPIMMLLLWSAQASAEDKPIKVINPLGGDCKIDDSYKRKLAQDAYTAVYDTRKNYEAYVKILKEDYVAAGGICHSLYSAWQHDGLNSLFNGGLESATQLEWTDYDWAGAEVVDSGQYKEKMNPTCKAMMEAVDAKSEYNDWDIHKMVEMAVSADSSIQNVFNWAQTAGEGATMNLSEKASDAICNALGGGKNGCNSTGWSNNDCNMIMKKGNSLVCYDTGSGSNTGYRRTSGTGGICSHESNNKCYNGAKREIPCSECVFQEDKDDIAHTFSSLKDFKNVMNSGDGNPNTAACLNKLKEAEKLRGVEGMDGGFIGNRRVAENALSILGGADTECFCEKDENGNLTDKIDKDLGCKSKQKTVEDNLEVTCPNVGYYQEELGKICLTCGLMANILGAGQKISKQAFEAISGSLIKLLEIAFLIYIAYTVLLVVASPEPQKLSKLLTSLLTQGTRVAIAILILLNPEYLYDKAINPILDGAVDFGLAFSNVSVNKEGESGTIKEVSESFGEEIRKAGADYTSGLVDPQSEYLSSSTIEKMVGANKNFSKEAAFMPALGQCLICNATTNIPSDAPNYGIIPRVKMLITGAILLIFGAMIWLAVGFYILDCCLQLCLIAAMMSFFVACWPFKLTNSYVKVGWNMFLNTFFNFVMMSVIIVTIALLTGQAVQRLGMTEEINNNNVDQIERNLELIGLGIIVMVVVCLICLKLSTESGRLANKFAGGAQIKMGGDLGGMAAGAVTQGGKAGFKTVGKGLGKVGGSIAESTGLKGAATAAKQGIKETFGGGTKSKGASFKQNDAAPKGGGKEGGKDGGKESGKEGGDDKGGKDGGEKSPESGGNE